MKKQDIVIGGTYTDGKGRIRTVVGEGPQFKIWPGQKDLDCILYEYQFRIGHSFMLKREKSTRAAFAAWAKARVKTEERKDG